MKRQNEVLGDLRSRVQKAVAAYWKTRRSQTRKQGKSGSADTGARRAVTGGAQMSGFVTLLTDILIDAGISGECIFNKRALELPGFFRPTKKWDLLVVRDGQLIAALEAKSQVGPSFGNNFNNRTEEAMGSALDLWTAFREGAFNSTVRPWLGYLFLLEDCPQSQSDVLHIREPHFEVSEGFKRASYAKRYELFCRKLVREQHYSAACFLLSSGDAGIEGNFGEPAADLTFELFAKSLTAQAMALGT